MGERVSEDDDGSQVWVTMGVRMTARININARTRVDALCYRLFFQDQSHGWEWVGLGSGGDESTPLCVRGGIE